MKTGDGHIILEEGDADKIVFENCTMQEPPPVKWWQLGHRLNEWRWKRFIRKFKERNNIT